MRAAAYLNPRVELDTAAGKLRVAFDIRNQSGETWRAAEGYAVGVHLFDAETGTLIVDGAHFSPGRDLADGESAPVRLELDVPPEDGRFQAFFSPLREHIGWFYASGWPFLLAEIAVRDGVPRLVRSGVSTAAAASGP